MAKRQFKAIARRCAHCGTQFFPAYPSVVTCCYKCWRNRKNALARKRTRSPRQGKSSYTGSEQQKRRAREKSKTRYHKLKALDPEAFALANAERSRRWYHNNLEKAREMQRNKYYRERAVGNVLRKSTLASHILALSEEHEP